jgi:hypothetical protein
VPPRSKGVVWRLRERLSRLKKHEWRFRKRLSHVPPQEFVNAPDAGATGYFLAILKTFVNFSFHAIAKNIDLPEP